ncbi:unnamed protein product, partial [Prunus brigantina]
MLLEKPIDLFKVRGKFALSYVYEDRFFTLQRENSSSHSSKIDTVASK